MPLTEATLLELQAEYFAEDVPIDAEAMASWTEDDARNFFDSGGTVRPGAAASSQAAPLQGLFGLPPSKLISGGELAMSSLAGKPAFISARATGSNRPPCRRRG